ncbi:MAG: type I restriction-modification system subunit M [Anaerolineae bacterium]|nr:type I restriction-modification system subunit M [Anaerolineae bacterium]
MQPTNGKTTRETPPLNQDEINAVLWKACDTFRGTIDPSEYKNYILVMLFLKYISDVWREDYENYQRQYPDNPDRVNRKMQFEKFRLPPNTDFYAIYERRDAPNLGEIIDTSLEAIERENKEKLEGVFRNISFNSEAALGKTAQRNERLKNLLNDFADPRLNLRPSRIGTLDIIGNAYEYLIARFASGAGKKAGEFYTPPEVSELLATLLDPQPGERICDPACGSGSLLIKCAKQVGGNNYSLWGQEANGATWALCMMNMFLHETQVKSIAWGDTLRQPMLLEGNQLARFNVVVANPPFSLDKWGAENAAGDRHRRFHRGVPPKSKGDYAFISHMIETTYLDPERNGRVGVIVPHGVLFRGGSEGVIRKSLIEENLLDAVIGLPPNIFYGTGIPVAVLIFKRHKADDSVMFIDASRDFEPGTNQNRLRPADLEQIVSTYRARQTVAKYACCASQSQIVENDYNLNIPRYVDTFEQEEAIDLKAVQAEITTLKGQLSEVETRMAAYLKELGLDS